MLKKYLKKLFDLLERPLPVFLTFHSRPKRASQVGVWSNKLKSMPRCAIVIQGPIIYDGDFTSETVRLYKKIFSEAIIIVSTWDYERKDYVEKIKNENVEIILNKPPECKGVSNINFQIVSTLAGLKKAKELGAEYVLKTRTDQRVYGINSLEFLVNIVEKFLPTGGFKQHRRIVGVSLNSFKYRLYGISDMNLFGQIDDVINYWDVEMVDNQGTTYAPEIKVNEVHLSTSLLKKIGREIKWTLDDSWQAFADCFAVVDAQSLDLYWYKYARMREYRYTRYDVVRNDQEMTFKEWFNIYTGLKNKIVSDQNIIKVIP